MASAIANRRGVALMITAMACYVLNDALVKLTSNRLPPGQILAVRGAFAFAVILAITPWTRGEWRFALKPIMGVRCAFEIATALTSVIALSLLPLATVSTLMMTAPLLIAAAAMLLRWEPWQGARVLATAIGFAGTLVVVRPSANVNASTIGLVCALLCAASLAGRDLVTRRIPDAIPSTTIAVMTTGAVCLAGVLLGLLERWEPLGRREVVALAGAAVCAAAGNYALIAACRGVDLSIVTPFRYSIIVWAMILGYAVWGHTPDLLSALGVTLIVLAGACAAYTALRRA